MKEEQNEERAKKVAEMERRLEELTARLNARPGAETADEDENVGPVTEGKEDDAESKEDDPDSDDGETPPKKKSRTTQKEDETYSSDSSSVVKDMTSLQTAKDLALLYEHEAAVVGKNAFSTLLAREAFLQLACRALRINTYRDLSQMLTGKKSRESKRCWSMFRSEKQRALSML